jgi:hypothetical protein
MVNLKKLIRKTKKPLKANSERTTFNGAVKTDMNAAINEILVFGALHG